ncbi:hypothetical protein ROZALSC1DRAFT_27864, partial [Rozella allomycis CSF55]
MTITVLVKHIPNVDSFSEICSSLGAIDIRLGSKFGKMRNSAFIDFPNTETVLKAQKVIPSLCPSSQFELARPLSDEKVYYRYPSINEQIAQNIVHALHKVPKLYVQVLHMMNKMNIPPPFIDQELFSNELIKRMFIIDEWMSSEEWELESEAEEPKRKRAREDIKVELLRNEVSNNQQEQLKIVTSSVKVDEKTYETNHERIEPVNDDNCIVEKAEEEWCLSLEETLKNKYTNQEIIRMKAFSKYHLGNPSRTLYIKNLDHKKVKKEDLRFVF